MCSRYTLISKPEAIREWADAADTLLFPPRYNIAPTQPVTIIRTGLSGAREMALVRWGLIPSWVKDPREFSTLINARSETAHEKPSFRASLRHRRCLIPADGFYEWTGKPGAKQPHLIAPKAAKSPLAFAGLWEHWLGGDGSELETMAILTTAANEDMGGIHDRMPLILNPEHFSLWLDCRSGSAEDIRHLLVPPPNGLLSIRPVSKSVNNSSNEGPDLHVPPQADRLL
ncbi:MAG: SOS response-associated peptidase [Hyphomicrobiaceae bacterium]